MNASAPSSSPAHPAPPPRIQDLLAGELSTASRLRYMALLLAAGAVTSVVGSLWATEPALPPRTHLAFALIVAAGISWMAFAVWVLTRRRVLLAGHRIVAARMAVGFSALFLVGVAAAMYWGGSPARLAGAAATGVVMLAAAAAMLVRAHRQFAALGDERRRLEREIERMRDR